MWGARNQEFSIIAMDMLLWIWKKHSLESVVVVLGWFATIPGYYITHSNFQEADSKSKLSLRLNNTFIITAEKKKHKLERNVISFG